MTLVETPHRFSLTHDGQISSLLTDFNHRFSLCSPSEQDGMYRKLIYASIREHDAMVNTYPLTLNADESILCFQLDSGQALLVVVTTRQSHTGVIYLQLLNFPDVGSHVLARNPSISLRIPRPPSLRQTRIRTSAQVQINGDFIGILLKADSGDHDSTHFTVYNWKSGVCIAERSTPFQSKAAMSSFSFLTPRDLRALITNEAATCIEVWFCDENQLHKAHILELPHIAGGITTSTFECIPLSPDILNDPASAVSRRSLISFDLSLCTRDGRQSGLAEFAVDTAYLLTYGLVSITRTTKWNEWGPMHTQMIVTTGNEPNCNTGGRYFATKRPSSRASPDIDNPNLLTIYNVYPPNAPVPEFRPDRFRVNMWREHTGPTSNNAFSREVLSNEFDIYLETDEIVCSRMIHHDGWIYAIKQTGENKYKVVVYRIQ